MPAANEVQTITFTGSATGGTWTITFDGQTTGGLAYNINAATLQTALEALSTIGSGNVSVSGSVGAGFTVTFQGTLANTDLPEMTVSDAGLTIAASTVSAATTTPGSSVAQEEQLIEFTVTPTGGTWSITFSGETTGALNYNSDAATIQGALESLPNIGLGNIVVQGNLGAGFTLQFTGTLNNTNVAQVTVSNIDLQQSASGATVNTVIQGTAGTAAAYEVFTVSGGTDETVTFTDGTNGGDVSFDSGGFISGYNAPTGYALTSGGGGGDTFATFTADTEEARPDQSKTSGGGGTVTVDQQGVDSVLPETERQTIQLTGSPDSGTWQPDAGAGVIDFDATSAEVEASLEADLGVGVAVTDNATFPNVTYTIDWDDYGNTDTLAPVTSNLTKAYAGSINVSTVTQGSAGVAEVQTLTLTDSPTGGTWTVFGGAALAYNVSAAGLESDIEDSIGEGVAVVKAGFQYTITFDVVGNKPQATGNGASLTKGWGGSIDVNTDTEGSPAASGAAAIMFQMMGML